ncbi:Sec-independent protein translocase protein TatB [Lysobacter sp. TAF61]|uniref:Sec-independent protein translocase protein TatB n=1 Tax=Lysobacter sp. TAF61 TaxID=3233072 RepID=UPI003F9D6ABE
MFDIGFSELFVIAIVALLVLGPERLPKAARFAGLWVRRARAQWHSVKSELEHELAAEELKRNLRDTEQSLREAHDEIKSGFDEARNRIQREGDALRRGVDEIDAELRSPATGSDTAENAENAEAPVSSEPAVDVEGSTAAVEPHGPTPAADATERK